MKSLFYRRGPARLSSERRTETSLLATRRWKLESRAHTDRPQEQPPLEWHERRVYRVRPLSLSFSVSVPFSLYLSTSFYLLGVFRLLGLLLLTLNQPYTLLAATILQIFVHRFYAVHRRSGSRKVAALRKRQQSWWELLWIYTQWSTKRTENCRLSKLTIIHNT